MTASGWKGTAARDGAAIGRALAHGAAWLAHACVTVITAFAHHHVPPASSTAAFAVTVVAVMAILFRSRKRPASG